MVRTTVGTIAEAELSVQEAESVTRITASQTTTVSQSSTQTTTVTAPSGTVLTVIGLRVLVRTPSGATTGTHTIRILGPSGRVRYLIAQSNFDVQILLNDSIIARADSTAQPSAEAAQADTIRSIQADDTRGVKFEYSNDTDAAQTENRFIDIIAIERGVSS